MVLRFVTFVFLFLFNHSLQAQSIDTVMVQADTLVVTATRSERPILDIPYAVDVVSVRETGETGLTLEHILQHVPGLIVDNRNNLSQGDRISIRGIGARASFGVRGIRVVLDDIPLTMPDGQSQLNNVDAGMLSQIEVLRGPSSTLYGNASGGVILMRAKIADRFQIVPSVQMGSHGFRRGQVFVSGQKERHGFALGVHHFVSEGFRENADAKTTGLMANTSHRMSEFVTLHGVLHFVDSPYLLNPSSLNKATADSLPQSARFFVKSQGAGKSVQQVQGGVSMRFAKDRTRGTLSVYGVKRTLFNPIPGRMIDLDRKAWGLRSVVQKEWTHAELLAGLDVEAQRDLRMEFDNEGLPNGDVGTVSASEVLKRVRRGVLQQDQHERVTGVGGFVQSVWKPNARWRIMMGSRYDRYVFGVTDRFLSDGVNHSGERVMRQMSPAVGVTFRPLLTTTLYANVGTAFQTPTTSELGNRPTGAGGFNLELQPEKTKAFEVGVKGMSSAGHIRYGVAIFGMFMRDMLFSFQIPDSEEIFYQNIINARNAGVEAHVQWYLNDDVYLRVTYTGQNFRFRESFMGGYVPGIPNHRVMGQLRYEMAVGIFLESNVRFIGESFTTNVNGVPQGPERSRLDFVNERYAVADIKAGLNRSVGSLGIGIFLDIQNIFNTRYNGSIVPNAFGERFFEPAPGRIIFGGLNIVFN